MTGYLYRGQPQLEQINARIMAERASRPKRWAEGPEELRGRDIPADCTCSWHWSSRHQRWVVDNKQHSHGCRWRRARDYSQDQKAVITA